MLMKQFYLATLAVFSLGFVASAQKVSGTVKRSLQDSTAGTALSDATVSVMQLPDSTLISFTLTNSTGYFEIKNLSAGDYSLVASFSGLQTFRKKFSISAAHAVEDFGSIKMNRSYKTLDEVVI